MSSREVRQNTECDSDVVFSLMFWALVTCAVVPFIVALGADSSTRREALIWITTGVGAIFLLFEAVIARGYRIIFFGLLVLYGIMCFLALQPMI